MRSSQIILVALAIATSAFTLESQTPAALPSGPPQQLRAFLDCQNVYCDRNFFITEMPYLLLTQDRLDADIHILMTGLQTGGGGTQVTIELVGQRQFAGRVDTSIANIAPNGTEEINRTELVRVLKLGLTPYLLRTAVASRFTLNYSAPEGAAPAGGTAGVVDPWNFWVYRVSAGGDMGAESRSQDYSVEFGASATRITEAWKLIVDAEYDYNSNTFKLDSSTVSFALRSAELELVALKSVTDHWSVGAGSNFEIDEFSNQDFAASLDLAAEWNYFPYREATRKQLVFIAGISNRYFDYTEETLFEKTHEFRTALVTKIAGETRQRWGSLYTGIEHIRYLHDASKYSATLYFNIDVRVSRGLNIYFGGDAQRVNDQLYLPRGDAEDDEVLTEQRALATAYRLNSYFGISYRFGSIFNNVVNPRFDNYP